MGAACPTPSFSFGPFQLEVRTGELRRNGAKVRLPHQSAQVLAMLLERAGDVVTREELQQRLWPNGTIVEFDRSINAVIKRLRQALDDSAEDPKFIETLPRRGYRFLLAVEQAAPEGTAVPSELEMPNDELVGKTISRYHILRKLGHGAMGIVYEAEDTKLGRSVALKFLPEEFSDDLQALERFDREARAASALNHPNIISVYDIGREKDTYWIVTELVQGETLCQLIGHGPLTVRKAIEIAVQVANGLASAHRASIVHRDLKPSNIIVSSDGIVKIIDFGLATLGPVDPDSSALDLKNGGGVLGTVGYMSPEQIRGQTADNRSDIFSFGVILYEMLAGKQAFSGGSPGQAMNAILKDDPPALPQSVPPSIERIVRRCIEKEPVRRFQSAADLEFALVAWPGSQSLPIEPARKSTSGPMWIAIAALVVAPTAYWLGTWAESRPTHQVPIRLNMELGPEFEVRGYGSSAVLSPDGRRLVYTGRGTDGKQPLYTRLLDQEKAVPLPGTEGGGYAPFISPDGRWVGFFVGGKLLKASIQGGGVVVLCDAPEGRGGSWGEDGNIVAALNAYGGLSRISSDGGSIESLTQLKQEQKEIIHRWPQVLPGAHAVLFSANTAKGNYDEATIEVQLLRTGERKTLVRRGYYGRYEPRSGHLLYVRDGTLFASSMDLKRLELTGREEVVESVVSNSAFGFAQVDVSMSGTLIFMKGKAPKQRLTWLNRNSDTHSLGVVSEDYFGPIRFSPDGQRLAVSVREVGNIDLLVYELERGVMTRLTFTPGADMNPVWSSDGRHLVFASAMHGGEPNLYWMRADGAGPAVRLTESKNFQTPHSFSPDGKRLAFYEFGPQNTTGLWILALEEVNSDHPKVGKPEPFLVTPFNQSRPIISSDGRWLAYESNETGRFEIYVQRFPGSGGKWRISTSGGSSPVWSRKRRELFYRSSEGIMEADYTVRGEAFRAGKARLWVKKEGLGEFDLAPDGDRFAVVQAETHPTQLTILLNFFDGLGQPTSVGEPDNLH